MGNFSGRMNQSPKKPSSLATTEPVLNFQFHDPLPEETSNGLYFCDVYLPEEIVKLILSYVDPKEILKTSLVCRKWCNIIKSYSFWSEIYSRQYKKKAKNLPWYVYYCLFSTKYFDQNLIKNGNGQQKFKYWKIILNYGDAFKIEDPPVGSDPLPPDIPEFNSRTSCFATSYYECNKLQEVSLENNMLMQLIMDKYKPQIYLSEWVAGRFDCGCVYTLWCKLYDKRPVNQVTSYSNDVGSSDQEQFDDDSGNELGEPFLHVDSTRVEINQWTGSKWSKVELVVKDYPKGVRRIIFQHEGKDTQFWKGHYGSKMAGGVLKILFDSIEPLCN